jgi:hypothetical protein
VLVDLPTRTTVTRHTRSQNQLLYDIRGFNNYCAAKSITALSLTGILPCHSEYSNAACAETSANGLVSNPYSSPVGAKKKELLCGN